MTGGVLDELLADPRVFRPRRLGKAEKGVLPTGFPALDAHLPGGGWPRGVLIELLGDDTGIGELRLLMPALIRTAEQGRWIVWVSPPHLPYAPALADRGLDPSRCLVARPGEREERIWTLEQSLRSGVCGAVLAWSCPMSGRHARRLQLAAEAGDALALVFQPASADRQRSPAALRLRLMPSSSGDGLLIDLFKCRGGKTGQLMISGFPD